MSETTNEWFYNGLPLLDSDIPEKAIGFIYLILNHKTSRKYVGRKLLTKTAYRSKNKVRKKVRVSSDWKQYWGSNAELISDYEKDPSTFSKHILCFTFSKGETLYLEEKIQYLFGVLESDKWYNSNIRTKIFKKWVIKFPSNSINFHQLLQTLQINLLLPLEETHKTDNTLV